MENDVIDVTVNIYDDELIGRFEAEMKASGWIEYKDVHDNRIGWEYWNNGERKRFVTNRMAYEHWYVSGNVPVTQ